MRAVRAEIAYWLVRLAFWIAPRIRDAAEHDLRARVRPYTNGSRQKPLHVQRPDGLSTSHGPPAPWAD